MIRKVRSMIRKTRSMIRKARSMIRKARSMIREVRSMIREVRDLARKVRDLARKARDLARKARGKGRRTRRRGNAAPAGAVHGKAVTHARRTAKTSVPRNGRRPLGRRTRRCGNAAPAGGNRTQNRPSDGSFPWLFPRIQSRRSPSGPIPPFRLRRALQARPPPALRFRCGVLRFRSKRRFQTTHNRRKTPKLSGYAG
jgi:hypothetical protein